MLINVWRKMDGADFFALFLKIRICSAKQVMLFSDKFVSMFHLSFCNRIYTTLVSLSFYREL